MKAGSIDNHAVLISHRLPDMAGGVCERRVWQLLTMLTRRCRVDLFCLAPGPVHWETYRRAHHLAHRMCVEPGGGWQDWLARPPKNGSLVRTRDVRRLARALQHQDWNSTAQVVVSTHPSLMLLGYVPPAQWRVCDLADHPETSHAQNLAHWLKHCDLLLTPDAIHTKSVGDGEPRVLQLPSLDHHDHATLSGFKPVIESEYEMNFWSRLHLPAQATRRMDVSLAKAA